MHVKKWVAVCLAAGLLFSLAGCQQEKENPALSGNYSGEVVAQSEFPSPEEDSKQKIGYQMELPEEGEEIAVIDTNYGTMKVRLFAQAAPKTVYNFKYLASTGYYDGLTFHRVVTDFIIQSGDPKGDSTGGESAWGEPFEDEFHSNLLNLYGSLSMANSGSNTNGSQFFINTAKAVNPSLWNSLTSNYEQLKEIDPGQWAQIQLYYGYTFLNTDIIGDAYKNIYEQYGGNPMLDGAYNAFDPKRGHTVFGQIFEGLEVADAINQVEVDENDKPIENVIVNSITIEEYKP